MTSKERTPAHWLGELLAVIHGDGGHYQDKHGDAKATEDAIAKWNARSVPETRAERIEEDTAGLPLTVEDWVAERLANTTRIAMTKTGADRASWIEDGRYWRLIYDRLRLKTEAQPLVEELLSACEAYHRALDTMFALMIQKTINEPEPFYPTQSGHVWDACKNGHALIERVKATLKNR